MLIADLQHLIILLSTCPAKHDYIEYVQTHRKTLVIKTERHTEICQKQTEPK